jgi:hypothetical protein
VLLISAAHLSLAIQHVRVLGSNLWSVTSQHIRHIQGIAGMSHGKCWVPPTEAQWLQWRKDFASRLKGVKLQRLSYRKASSSDPRCIDSQS